MAIQNRRGSFDEFATNQLKDGEWAVVIEGDSSSSDGTSVYLCFKTGNVKRMATYNDMVQNITEATTDVANNLVAEASAGLQQATAEAQTATTNANMATTEAKTAITNADAATTAAQAATEAANTAASKAESYVLGDVSEKMVEFTTAKMLEELVTGEDLSTLFGKITKWFTELGTAAFKGVSNALTQTADGYVLDARQGKVLNDSIGDLSTLTTDAKGSAVAAVNEVGDKLGALQIMGYEYVSVSLTDMIANGASGTASASFNGVAGATNYVASLVKMSYLNPQNVTINTSAKTLTVVFLNTSGATHSGNCQYLLTGYKKI